MIANKKTTVIGSSSFALLPLCLALFFLVTLPGLTEATSTCMYCRRADKTATFLVTYSFCESSDICLQDKWNYIDYDCKSGWHRGKNVALDSCSPNITSCHSFVSSPNEAG